MTLAVAVGMLGMSACSSGDASPSATSRAKMPEANPLKPGTGYVQIGAQRTDFDKVICATGPVKTDPKGTIRQFGAYANFTLDGNLAAVSLTRYENRDAKAIPTVTDTALIQMQGEGEVRGLKAQRANIIGQNVWSDVADDSASTPLIERDGDRYRATGKFGSPDGLGAGETPTQGTIEMRCPAKTTSTTSTATDDGATAPSSTTTPATSVAPARSDAPTTSDAPAPQN